MANVELVGGLVTALLSVRLLLWLLLSVALAWVTALRLWWRRRGSLLLAVTAAVCDETKEQSDSQNRPSSSVA